MKVETTSTPAGFQPVTITIKCETAAELAALLCRCNVGDREVMKRAPSAIKNVDIVALYAAVESTADLLWNTVMDEARAVGIYDS